MIYSGMDILIFDDDPHASGLIFQVVSNLGFSIERFSSGTGAVEIITKIRPRLIILDIMMPGMDGLTILQKVRSKAELKGMHVLICSSKSFQRDIDEVLRLGADAFIPKGNIQMLRKKILALLGSPPADKKSKRLNFGSTFQARIWGCTGPAIENGPENSGPCVSIHIGDRILFLDAGTGINSLPSLPEAINKELWLILSGYAPDHIGGLKNFVDQLSANARLKIAGPSNTRGSLNAVVDAYLKGSPHIAQISLFMIHESGFSLFPGATCRVLLTNHPGTALAISIEHLNRRIIYCPNNEVETPDEDELDSSINQKFEEFIRGADVLIHDARYTEGQYPGHRREGHSSTSAILNLASQNGIRKLIFFRMDRNTTESQIKAEQDRIDAKIKNDGLSIRAEYARPGLQIAI